MLWASLLVAAYSGTLEFGASASARARDTEVFQAQGGSDRGIDLATRLEANARVRDRRWEYTLTYAPTLTLPDIDRGLHDDQQLLHTGRLAVGWHDRFVRITASVGATYGQLQSAFLYQTQPSPPSGQPAPVQAVPQPTRTLDFASVSPDAIVSGRLGRRATLAVGGGYYWTGGLNPDSRRYLPEEFGPHASVAFSYSLSRRDTLATNATVSIIQIRGGQCPGAIGAPADHPCSERANLFTLSETYTRRLSVVTRMMLGIGAAMSYAKTEPSAPYRTIPYVSGLALLSHRFGRGGSSEAAVSLELAPLVNPLTGAVTEQAVGAASLRSQVTSVVGVRGGLGVSHTVFDPGVSGVTVVSGNVGAGFRVYRRVEASLGVEGLWQRQTGYGTFFSGFAYFALTVRTRALRF